MGCRVLTGASVWCTGFAQLHLHSAWHHSFLGDLKYSARSCDGVAVIHCPDLTTTTMHPIVRQASRASEWTYAMHAISDAVTDQQFAQPWQL
jgi:hypothetical protein